MTALQNERIAGILFLKEDANGQLYSDFDFSEDSVCPNQEFSKFFSVVAMRLLKSAVFGANSSFGKQFLLLHKECFLVLWGESRNLKLEISNSS